MSQRPSSGVLDRLRAYLVILFLTTVQVWPLLRSGSFGSEFTQFYGFVNGKSLARVLALYGQFNMPWYRPSQFFLPYWLGEKIVDWHNIAGWRLLQYATLLIAVFLIYELVLFLLPGRPAAALVASVYFGFNPTIYISLFELFAFDFIHIVFVLLCVISYLRSFSRRAKLYLTLSAACFAVALTSKEIALATPLFLVAGAAVLGRRNGELWGRTAAREALRLLPLFGMCVIYWWLHIRQIPEAAFNSTGEYRIGFNAELLVRNFIKYLLWASRIFHPTPDTLGQASGYMGIGNGLIGASILVLTAAGCRLAWRRKDEASRRVLLLMSAWILAFLAIPAYSGGYLWHGNLALCGFAALAGLAADEWWTRLSRGRLPVAALVAIGICFTGYTDATACLNEGIHSEAFRINSRVLNPPVLDDAVGKGALLYVEDRLALGEWWYGAGSLFKLVYRDQTLTQVVVPRLEEVDSAKCRAWLAHPKAFFFRYDNSFRWLDASAEFRAYAAMRAKESDPAPRITLLTQSETRKNRSFNIQPSGASAIGISGESFAPGAVILFGSTELPTVYGGGKWITGSIEPKLLARPGILKVTVRNPDGQVSNPSTFTIR